MRLNIRPAATLLAVVAAGGLLIGCSDHDTSAPVVPSTAGTSVASAVDPASGPVATQDVLTAIAAVTAGDTAPAEAICARLVGDTAFWLDGVTDTANASASKDSYLRCRYPHTATGLDTSVFSLSIDVDADNETDPTQFEQSSIGWTAAHGKGDIDISVLTREEPSDAMKDRVQAYMLEVMARFGATN